MSPKAVPRSAHLPGVACAPPAPRLWGREGQSDRGAGEAGLPPSEMWMEWTVADEASSSARPWPMCTWLSRSWPGSQGCSSGLWSGHSGVSVKERDVRAPTHQPGHVRWPPTTGDGRGGAGGQGLPSPAWPRGVATNHRGVGGRRRAGGAPITSLATRDGHRPRGGGGAGGTPMHQTGHTRWPPTMGAGGRGGEGGQGALPRTNLAT